MQEPFVIRAHDARLVSAGMPSRDLLQYVRYGRRRETAGTQRAGHGPTMVSHVMSAVLVADCGDAAVSSASPGATTAGGGSGLPAAATSDALSGSCVAWLGEYCRRPGAAAAGADAAAAPLKASGAAGAALDGLGTRPGLALTGSRAPPGASWSRIAPVGAAGAAAAAAAGIGAAPAAAAGAGAAAPGEAGARAEPAPLPSEPAGARASVLGRLTFAWEAAALARAGAKPVVAPAPAVPTAAQSTSAAARRMRTAPAWPARAGLGEGGKGSDCHG